MFAPAAGRRNGGARRPVSRVLSPPEGEGWPFIWDARHRTPRATNPGGRRGNPPSRRPAKNGGAPPLFGLAPGGVYRAADVTAGAVRSYRTLSPLPASPGLKPIPGRGGRFAFCGTFPGVAPAGRYPAPCFRGARTFLPPADRRAAIRPSDAAIEVCSSRADVKQSRRRQAPAPAAWAAIWKTSCAVSGSATPSTRRPRK